MNVRFLADYWSLVWRKVQRKIVSITLMHYFHAKVGTVKDVTPSVYNMTLTLNNGLIEVESVEVKSHGADAESGKPDSQHWPRSEEKM